MQTQHAEPINVGEGRGEGERRSVVLDLVEYGQQKGAHYPKGTIAAIVLTLKLEVSMRDAFELLGCPVRKKNPS
jgi:hypothetical protein